MTDNNDKKKNDGDKQNKLFIRENTWLVVVIVVLVLAFTVGIVFTLFYNLGSSDKGSGRKFSLGSSVAVLDVTGEIGDTSLGAAYDHDWTMSTIGDLIDDSSNRGIVIRVNSPGGSVYKSDELYEELLKYKKETGRPIYVYFQDEAASGGYYISMAADKIYANRNTWTGSIGVTMGTQYDVTGLLDKLGIKTHTITSGRNKAMGSMTAELTDEQRRIMQSLIDESYDQFVKIVAKGRNMPEEKVREIGDGRIYSAKQAKALGLIDEICGEEEFFDKVRKMDGLEGVDFDFMHPDTKTSFLDMLQQLIQSKSEIGKASEYRQLIDLSKNGNKFNIKYLAEISK